MEQIELNLLKADKLRAIYKGEIERFLKALEV